MAVYNFADKDVISKTQIHTQIRTPDVVKEYYVLTGIVIVNLHCTTKAGWQHDTLQINIGIPELPQGKMLHVEQSAVFIALSSMWDSDYAVNAGWAVDEFGCSKPGNNITSIELTANVATSDNDGWLYRVSYNVTLLGQLTKAPSP